MQMAFQRLTPPHNNTLVKADDQRQELYEPLWEDLYHRLKNSHIYIRGIWIADVAFQGASGALNERQLGNDRELNRPA